MTRLRIVALDDTVVFPGMPISLPVDVGEDDKVLLVPRHGNSYGSVGVVAEVSERMRVAGRGLAASMTALHRGVPGAASTDADGVLRVDVDERPDQTAPGTLTHELEREYRAVVDEILELRGDDGRIRAFVRSITEAGALADTAGYSPDLNFNQKRQLLETLDVVERLKLALQLQRERLAELQVRKRIQNDVEDGTQKQQREYFLRRQMDAIRKELGEADGSVVEEYREKIADAGMPDAVREQAERELGRLERMGDSNAESGVIRTYLDWLLAVPWAKRSEERLDPRFAREVLDADHEGLDDVKKRITEYLAVRKLRSERGMVETRRSGVILTLIGPPGTGKTSIGESIARATGRQFVRMSLGGVRDEAEIRGHRRTYIGALPGRLVRALRDAGTMNPVIMLDEVDKLGADWRGDPSAALLEVLDPAQNHAFRDHYLDVELDLSQVLFVATANVADTIPAALFDRMEVIRFDGYTTEEKVAIARRPSLAAADRAERPSRRRGRRHRRDPARDRDRLHARGGRPSARTRAWYAASPDGHAHRRCGPAESVTIDASAVRDALGRPKVFHEAAVRTAVPGVATGLAVTGVGGDVLFVEAAAMPGKGGLVLTGQLGDVMKESARIALTYVKSHARELDIDEHALDGREVHVHVPAGAIPKDGPSAGITMVTAIASLLTGRPVKSTVGMTGEVTLQGRVLPIGGLKQKVLAAYAAGLTEVIVPERNQHDLDDVPARRAGPHAVPHRRRGGRSARSGVGARRDCESSVGSRRALIRPACGSRDQGSALPDIESIEIHHLVPRSDEVAHELLLRVVARVDLRERAQLGVRAEDEVHAARGPPGLAFRAAATRERLRRSRTSAPTPCPCRGGSRRSRWSTSPGRLVNTPCVRLPRVRVQHPQAADEHRHLGRAQRQPEGPLDQQMLGRHLVSLSQEVAEPVRVRLEHGERLDVGLLLRRIRAARRERHLHVVAGLLRRLLDGRVAAEHDQVGERHLLLAAGLRVVELLLNPLQGLQHLRQLRRIVDRPILLRREPDARAVGAAALVGAAERRCRRPGRRDELGRWTVPTRGSCS